MTCNAHVIHQTGTSDAGQLALWREGTPPGYPPPPMLMAAVTVMRTPPPLLVGQLEIQA